jgi:hypothetical protein
MGIFSYFRDLRRINLPPIIRKEVTITVEREPLADGSEKVTRTVTRKRVVGPTTSLTVNGKPFPRRRP